MCVSFVSVYMDSVLTAKLIRELELEGGDDVICGIFLTDRAIASRFSYWAYQFE